MLEQVLDYIHNYFIKEEHSGEFTISEHALVVDFLLDGQYFKIEGSVLNDGVYQYPATELHDEVFTGKVISMAIPRSLLILVEEIQGWITKFGESSYSPFQSESFGGYSYTKGSTTDKGGKSGAVTWQSVFATRLNAYRKIS